MKEIKFVKAVASGNDFIIIDRFRAKSPPANVRQWQAGKKQRVRISKLAKELCQRKFSVGADGLLLIEPSIKADFKMRTFNPDGTEVEMCGNGLRCAALYAVRMRICANKMVIQTGAGNLPAEIKQNMVKIKMTPAQGLKLKFELDINGQTQNVNYIDTGVPHVVCFVPGLDDFAVEEAGRAIRYHPEFQPDGTNVDFVEVLGKSHIRVRTYERGVEQETLSCGTGAVAASIITTYQMEEPQGTYRIKVDTQGGETLFVDFNIENGNINELFLEGKAEIVYKGGVDV